MRPAGGQAAPRMEEEALLLLLLGTLLCFPGPVLTQAEECNSSTATGGDDRRETTDVGQLLNLTVGPGGGPDSLLLRWTKPVPDVLSYFIVLYEAETTAVRNNASAGRDSTSLKLEGLVPGTHYNIQVTAVSECSGSPAQMVGTWTNPLAVQNATLRSRLTPSELSASWDEPPGGKEGYRLTLYRAHSVARNVSLEKGLYDHRFDGLDPGTEYSLEIATLSGPYQASTRVSQWTHPLAVQNATLRSRLTPSELSASWDEPPGGKEGYRLTLYRADSVARNVSLEKGLSEHRFDGLDPGTEYSLELATLSGPYRASTRVSQWTRPLPPSKVTLQNPVSSSSLNATWDNPFGAAWFHLTLYAVASQAVTQAVSAERGVSEYTFQDLTPGTQYCLVITAASGPYRMLGPNVTDWTYPLAPANISLRSSGHASTLHAQWTNPAGERGSYLVILHNAETSVLAKNISTSGNTTDVEVQGLAPGTQYTLRVTAIAGPYQVASRDSEAWTSPLAPPGLNLSSQGSVSTLYARWDKAADSGYVITLYTAQPFLLLQNSSLGRDVTNFTYQALAPGTQYVFEIRTVAGSHTSASRSATEWTHPVAPEHVSLQTQGCSSVLRASWQAPAVGEACTYAVTLSETRSQVLVRNVTLEKGVSELPLEGLISGRQYTLQICTVAGPYSSPIQTATNWTCPSVPPNITLTNRGQHFSLYASWDSPPGDQGGFFLRLYSAELQLEKNASMAPGQRNLTLDGLLPGNRYSLEVSTIAGPYGSPVAEATEWTYPLAPAHLEVENGQSSSSLCAHWTLADGGGELWIQLYTVHSPSAIQNISVERGATNVTLDGLTPGTQYLLQVISQAGPYRTASPRVSGYTYPLVPPSLKVARGGDPTSLVVQWEAPAGDREGYSVSLSQPGAGTPAKHLTIDKDSTAFTFTELMPGSWYTIRVQAVAGNHFKSAMQNITACTEPLAPSNVNFTSGGCSTMLQATWTPPDGMRDSYRLILHNVWAQAVVANVSAGLNLTHFTFSGLSPGSSYTMRIAAVCGHHESYSPNLTEWTYPVAPLNLTILNLGSPSALHVSWEEPAGHREGYTATLYDASTWIVAGHTSVGRGTRNYTFENLTPGKRYIAEASAVAGPYQATAQNVTNWTCPLAPPVVNVSNAGSRDRLQASWDVARGGRDSYEAILYDAKLRTVAGKASVDGDTRSYAFTGLIAGKEYRVQIAAFAGSCGAFSMNMTEWTYPFAPPRVHTNNEGSHDRLMVFWEEATGQQDGYVMGLYDAGWHPITREEVVGGGARNYSFSGLIPGSKYRAEVVSVAGPYRSSAAHITDWTYPLAPSRVHVTNAGSPDSLRIFWEEALGDHDSYTVVLYDAAAHTVRGKASVRRDTHNYTFSGLIPGRKYSAEIAAIAGPYGRPAANVTDWTYPLASPKVSVTNEGSPDRLHASWGEAMGERDGYNVALYDARSGAIARNASIGKHTRDFTFTALTPGNKYNIEVVARAGPYRASAANITDWTYPLAPENISVVIEENNTVLVLSWTRSSGLQDYYQAWLMDIWNQTESRNQTLDKEEADHVFHGLMPGRNYSVSLSSVVGPYHNSSGSLLVPVEPNPVTTALCWANETGMYLNWSQPQEETESCWLDVEKRSEGTSLPVWSLRTTESEASLHNLAPNTSYQIGLTMIGRNGMRSPTVILVCNTSQEVQPPPPSHSAPLFDAEVGVIISSDMFSEENGRIEFYGIIVTSNTSLSRPTQDITTSTWYDHYYGHEDTYLAVLVRNPFQPRERDATNRTVWAVPMGTQECNQTREICNGRLKADTLYRFSVAAFTRYDALDPAVSFSAFSAAPGDGDSSSFPVPVVAGVVGGCLLTAVAVLGLIFWRRSRLRRKKKNHPTQEMTAYSLRNSHRSIPVQNFKQVYEMKAANSSQIFFQEFEELKEVGKDQSKVEAELPANLPKNRYPHVLPYDHSRVKLSLIGEDPTSDYINANFIPGYIGYQEYISTQGPLKKTIEDFWRLIWEYNVRNIVMLTVCMENGRVLCDHYWPSDGSSVSYGQISVRLVAQDISSDWTMREFRLWHDGLKLERDVHQLHYTAWPDHGLPESTSSMIEFVELVREHIQVAKGSGPTVVHCSAGVGRTGTFIGLDRVLQQMRQERVVDVFYTVYTMRLSRYLMLQTLGQYIFVHACILDKITEEQLSGLPGKETSRPILQKTFSQHYLKKSANGNAGFLREYEVLLEVAKDEASGDPAAAPFVNQQTHSYSSILPYDRCRVKFSPVGPDPLSDGAKAWFIPGFSSAKDYLAIHGPQQNTMEQFWRMVWEHNVHTIVTLVPFNQKDELPGTECWPTDSSPVCTGSLSVHLTAMKDILGWKCTHLKMKHEKKVKERQLHCFLFPLWNAQDEPNAESIFKFLAALRQSAPSRKRSAPLLVHCSAGVGHMGTFLALDCLLHQAKSDKSVDVYGVTLRIAKSCCFMTPTMDQYVYLHACLKNLLSQKQP